MAWDTTPQWRKKVHMKRRLVVLPFAALLFVLTAAWVGASMDDDDPQLCVNGKWLLVKDAKPAAVTVFVPEGAMYGNAEQGGCPTPGLDAPMVQVVKELGERHWMRVMVDGANASRPEVAVTFGEVEQNRSNNGHGKLNFVFSVQ
jgi:hypothetical protein